jgi:hypothetical protein
LYEHDTVALFVAHSSLTLQFRGLSKPTPRGKTDFSRAFLKVALDATSWRVGAVQVTSLAEAARALLTGATAASDWVKGEEELRTME